MGETATQEYEWLSEAATPAGVEIRYAAKPKRCYQIREFDPNHPAEAQNGDWMQVPSVTDVLGVLDKPGLPWWGMKTGVEGLSTLYRTSADASVRFDIAMLMENGETQAIVDELTKHKLTVNHVRDKAGARGQAVHDVLEHWANFGGRVDPMAFPEEERGYIEGLLKFLDDVDPEPIASEVMVGSLEHGFAGRYDIRFKVNKECRVVYKHTPKKGDHYAILKPGLYLGDLKTSSGVYPSHSMQLEGYEGASVECGFDSTMARGIIHTSGEGWYEFVRSTAGYEDFLNVKRVWDSFQAMKGRKR